MLKENLLETLVGLKIETWNRIDLKADPGRFIAWAKKARHGKGFNAETEGGKRRRCGMDGKRDEMR